MLGLFFFSGNSLVRRTKNQVFVAQEGREFSDDEGEESGPLDTPKRMSNIKRLD